MKMLGLFAVTIRMGDLLTISQLMKADLLHFPNICWRESFITHHYNFFNNLRSITFFKLTLSQNVMVKSPG